MGSARCLTILAVMLASSSAHPQYTDGAIKIGVLSDMSGLAWG
jgi:hypothetical protein